MVALSWNTSIACLIGNDLARVLKWGSGYENQNLAPILEDVLFAEEVMFDRFVHANQEATSI